MPDDYTEMTLGEFSFTGKFLSGAALGAPQRNIQEATSWLADVPTQTGDGEPVWRQQAITVRLRGVASASETAADNKARQLHNLIAEVAKTSNLLAVKPRGMAKTASFIVGRNDRFALPLDRVSDQGQTLLVPLTLNVLPWVLDEAVTVETANVVTPAFVSFTIPGEEPTPVTVNCAANWAGFIKDMRVAVVPAATGITDVIKDAYYMVGAAWTKVTDASAVHGHDRELTASTWRAIVIGSFPAGRYRILARCRATSDAHPGSLALSRDHVHPSALRATVRGHHFHIIDLGDWASDGYSDLAVVGRLPSGYAIRVDWFAVIGLDSGDVVAYEGAETDVTSVRFLWLDATEQHSGGATTSARRYLTGMAGLRAVGDIKLLVMASDYDSDIKNPSVHVVATATPRYWHWIPNSEE